MAGRAGSPLRRGRAGLKVGRPAGAGLWARSLFSGGDTCYGWRSWPGTSVTGPSTWRPVAMSERYVSAAINQPPDGASPGALGRFREHPGGSPHENSGFDDLHVLGCPCSHGRSLVVAAELAFVGFGGRHTGQGSPRCFRHTISTPAAPRHPCCRMEAKDPPPSTSGPTRRLHLTLGATSRVPSSA